MVHKEGYFNASLSTLFNRKPAPRTVAVPELQPAALP